MDGLLEEALARLARALRFVFRGLWVREESLQAVGRLLRLVLWDMLIQGVLHLIGRVFLLVVTLGRFPRIAAVKSHSNLIAWTGIAVVVAVWTGIALFNNLS